MFLLLPSLLFNFFLSPTETSLDSLDRLTGSSANETHIYIVRHGESAFNQPDSNGITYTSGKSITVPLTEKGEQQASDMGRKLKGKLLPNKEYVILSSIALRAQETADRIFNELKSEYLIERGSCYEDLCEIGQGIWEGKPKDSQYETFVKVWEALPANEKFTIAKLPTGESYAEAAARARTALQGILEENRGKTIFVVSHYATTNALAIQLSGCVNELSQNPGSKLPSINLQNCDIVEISVPDGHSIEEAIIIQHIKANV